MPFEAIACTTCGSTDVQEVKPSTYFCNHCETVFKHIDPTRISVDNAPAFCSCGNPIEFQCQLCKTGMCFECDVIAWRENYDRSRIRGIISAIPVTIQTSAIYVPVQGFGYTGNARKYGDRSDYPEAYKVLSVSGRHVVRYSYKPDDRFGPWLSLDKLLAVLSEKRVRLGHACWPCIGRAVPELAERIATGAICETPTCANEPKQACSCCGSAFCESCLTPSVRALWSDGSLKVMTIHVQNPGDGKGRPQFTEIELAYGSAHRSYTVKWQPPDGLCLLCGNERVEEIRAWQDTARKELANVLDPDSDHDGRAGIGEQWFYAPTERRRTRTGRLAEFERARGVAERCAAELTERLKQLRSPEACQRDPAYAARTWYAWYAVTDNRAQTAPALTPRVTDTGE
jgi:hypothetical protein